MYNASTNTTKVEVILNGKDEIRNKFCKCVKDFEKETNNALSERNSFITATSVGRRLLTGLELVSAELVWKKNKLAYSPWHKEHYIHNPRSAHLRGDVVRREGVSMLFLTKSVSHYYRAMAAEYENVLAEGVKYIPHEGLLYIGGLPQPHDGKHIKIIQIYWYGMNLVYNAGLKMSNELTIRYFEDKKVISNDDYATVVTFHEHLISIFKTISRHAQITHNQVVSIIGEDTAKQQGFNDVYDSATRSLQRLCHSVNECMDSYGPKNPGEVFLLAKEAKKEYSKFMKRCMHECDKQVERVDVEIVMKDRARSLKNGLAELRVNTKAVFKRTLEHFFAEAQTFLESKEGYMLDCCVERFPEMGPLSQDPDLDQQQGGPAIG